LNSCKGEHKTRGKQNPQGGEIVGKPGISNIGKTGGVSLKFFARNQEKNTLKKAGSEGLQGIKNESGNIKQQQRKPAEVRGGTRNQIVSLTRQGESKIKAQ